MTRHFLFRLLIAVCCYLVSIPPQASDHPCRCAVASAHPLATRAGLEILDEGGNAFDAAVAVAAVLSVVEPYSSGMGGGGFWLLHEAETDRDVMIDGRERAPFAADPDMYLDKDGDVIPGLSINGALAAGIPGQVAALVHINRKYGSMPLERLFQSAITLARNGFDVSDRYQRLVNLRIGILQDNQWTTEIFLDDGDIPAPGYVLKQPALARTLDRVAATQGRDFYHGEIARNMVAAVRKAGGIWSMRDLSEYRVIEREPVKFNWRELHITSASLPSSGGVVLATIFNILHSLDWNALNDIQKKHLAIEAMRRAYRDRAEYLGDPDVVKVPVELLISQSHAKRLAADIETDVATPSQVLKKVPVRINEGRDTTHYSILDGAGNRVAATLSINYPFGSGFVAGDTGILLNDEMDDFASRPGTPNVYGLTGNKANAIAPGKRMLSSMTPTFVESDKHLAIMGTPGGSRIISMLMLAIMAFENGDSAKSIVTQPRYHHQYLPDRVQFEPNAFSDDARRVLAEMGHKMEPLDSEYGNMQVIIMNKNSGKIEAASDPRGIGFSGIE